MEYLKKNKKWIIFVIILMIAVSGVSVYATSTYLASQVTYKDGKTVEQALNELYTKNNQSNNPITIYSAVFDEIYYYENGEKNYLWLQIVLEKLK